jgi:hypothetical protein
LIVFLELFTEFEEGGCCEGISVRLQPPNGALRDRGSRYPSPARICKVWLATAQ